MRTALVPHLGLWNPCQPMAREKQEWGCGHRKWGRDLSPQSEIFAAVVQPLSHVALFGPHGLQHQAPLSCTISWSLLRFMSNELMMLSNHLIPCCPLLLLPSIFPNIRVFPMRELFASNGQSIGASSSATVLPTNIQGWFPLEFSFRIELLEVQDVVHYKCIYYKMNKNKHKVISTC